MKILEFIKTKKSQSSGFTLIELLVVIGILGILAAALVATIDPFEQLKKATDSRVKNTAVEFLNSTIRYYTTHSAMPWSDPANTACLGGDETGIAGNRLLPTLSGCLTSLITEGELKSAFTTATNDLSSLYATESNNDLTVCFAPESKSQQKSQEALYDYTGATKSGCPAVNSGCYICTR